MSSANGATGSFLLTSKASELENFRLNYDFQKANEFIDSNKCPTEMALTELSLERDELYVHKELLAPGQVFHYRQVAVHSSYHPKPGGNPLSENHEPTFTCSPETCDSNKLSEYLKWHSLVSIKDSNRAIIEKLAQRLKEDQVMLESKDKYFQMHRKITLGRVYLELDEMEAAMEIFDQELKILDLVSSKITTPEKTYIYLRSSIPRLCCTLLAYCVQYVKNGDREKAVMAAKIAIDYLRVLLDSSLLAMVVLVMAIAVLLENKRELLTCAVGMRLFLMITVSLRSWGKLRVLDEYTTLLENRFRFSDYDENFVNDRSKISISLTLGVRDSPDNIAEDLLLCDFLGYTYFGDSVAKTRDEVTYLMTRVNKTTFRLARSGFFRNLSLLYRNLFRHRVGTASLYRRLFLSLVSANLFDEALLAYEQYIQMMNRSERKSKIDPFLCLVASKCYLINQKKYAEAIDAATIAVDLSTSGPFGDTNARAHHYLGLAIAEKARHACEADVIKTLRSLALDELNRARHLDPFNDSLMYDLAFIYSESREIPLAIRTVRASLRQSNGQTCKWHLLALLHSSKRNYTAALDICDYLVREDKTLKSLNMILKELGRCEESLQVCLTIFAIWNHYMVKVKFRDEIEVVNPYRDGTKFEAMKGPQCSESTIDGSVKLEDWLSSKYPQSVKRFLGEFVKMSVIKRRNSSITTGYQWLASSDFPTLSSFGIYLAETMGLSRADFFGHVWIHLSQLYVSLSLLEDAKESMQQALSLNEMSPIFYAHAGHLQGHLGDWEKAFQYYFRAIALDPDCVEALLGLGYLYLREGASKDLDLSSYYLREVLARDPFSHDAWLFLGQVESANNIGALDKLFFARQLASTLPIRPFSCCPSSIG